MKKPFQCGVACIGWILVSPSFQEARMRPILECECLGYVVKIDHEFAIAGQEIWIVPKAQRRM
jgi:hypothetical protein